MLQPAQVRGPGLVRDLIYHHDREVEKMKKGRPRPAYRTVSQPYLVAQPRHEKGQAKQKKGKKGKNAGGHGRKGNNSQRHGRF